MNIFNNIKDIFRPVLSDKTILKYNEKHLLVEGKLSESQIQPNSIDLTLGNTWKKLTHNNSERKENVTLGGKDYETMVENNVDLKKPITYDEGLFSIDQNGNQYYKIMPGEFVLMASNEILNIPNGILSFVQGRSSIARVGIQTEQAGLIDAGFRGTITFEVFNQTEYPIYLYEGMRIAQVYFFKAQYANKVYGKEKGSKYSGQIEATGSMIYKDPELNKYPHVMPSKYKRLI